MLQPTSSEADYIKESAQMLNIPPIGVPPKQEFMKLTDNGENASHPAILSAKLFAQAEQLEEMQGERHVLSLSHTKESPTTNAQRKHGQSHGAPRPGPIQTNGENVSIMKLNVDLNFAKTEQWEEQAMVLLVWFLSNIKERPTLSART